MKGVINRFGLKPGESKSIGNATISAFEFKNSKDPIFNLRAIMNGGHGYIEEGEYVRLHINGDLFMSDTTMEKNSNYEFVQNATGRVFIAGLGIGLILHNLIDRIHDKTITKIVIMEKEQDVIDLIKPYFKEFPITYLCDDVLNYIPPKDEKFDTIYFDIWEEVSTDNLKEISMLHNRWKYRKIKGGWMASWMQDHLRRERKMDNLYY